MTQSDDWLRRLAGLRCRVQYAITQIIDIQCMYIHIYMYN